VTGASEVERAAAPVETDVPNTGGAGPARRAASGLVGGASAIWIRELRGRMRGKRAFIFVTVYLLVLVGLLWLALGGVTAAGPIGAMQSVTLGRTVFGGVILVETLVVIILAPAYLAGSISQEREKQTFDLLAVTPISSLAIVLGKLVSGLAFLAVIVGASLPLASLAFMFGGIGPEDLLAAYFMLAILGMGAGAIGIFCSAFMRRTGPATVAAFLGIGLVTVGTTALWISLEAQAQQDPAARPPEAILYLNPFVAEGDILCAATGALCVTAVQPVAQPIGPAPAIVGAVPAAGGAPGVVGPATGVVGPGVQPPAPDIVVTRGGSLWPKSAIAWLLVAVILVAAAAQSVSPTRRWRLPTRTMPAAPDSGQPR
jgi:ABC-type transport system involved in multi-copper enzyme maturation permease subunit